MVPLNCSKLGLLSFLSINILGKAGRSVSFATEEQRKIVREIVQHARRPVKARVIPPAIIQKYVKRIAALEADVTRILEEESAEKEIAKLENRANRMQNQLETVSSLFVIIECHPHQRFSLEQNNLIFLISHLEYVLGWCTRKNLDGQEKK